MKKLRLLSILLITTICLSACFDEGSDIVDINIIASNTYDNYVYKERLKIISTEDDANQVSEFFVENLHKVDILSSFTESNIFEEYALLTGYINVSFLDRSITIEKVTKKSDNITVQLSSDFDYDSDSLSDRANLSYVYFIIQIDKQFIDSSTLLDIAFITNSTETRQSTYEFSNQPAFISDIQAENIYEYKNIVYNGPIAKVESLESFNLMKNNIEDSANLDGLAHDSTFFDTHAYIFANYTYTSKESVVSVMGLVVEGNNLQLVINGNVPDNIEIMQFSKQTKLFVIDVLKSNIENIDSYSYKNYNLYNGNSSGVINNNNIAEAYNLIEFEVIDSLQGKSAPFSICSLRSMIDLGNTIEAWQSSTFDDVSYLSDYSINTAFFTDKQLIVLPLTYRSSDLNVQVSEIRNYGSYFEIITTTDNTEFGDQTYGIDNEVFIISISKDFLTDETVFVNSMIYLGDQ